MTTRTRRRPTIRPSTVTVAQRVAMTTCRTFGHAWFESDLNGWYPAWGIPIALTCERCATIRRDVIDALGNLSQRAYVYPEGYAWAEGGDGPPSRADYRLRYLDQTRRAER